MTSKQRLSAVFTGKQPDRVPIWMMYPYEEEPFAADVHNEESYRDAVELVKQKTDFIERNATNTDFLIGKEAGQANVDYLFNHPEVEKTEEHRIKGKRKTIIHRVSYRNIEFEKKIVTTEGRTTVEPYLKRIEDLYGILEMPYQLPVIDLSSYRARAERLGENGLHGIQCIDPISVFHDLCSEVDFTLWVYTHQDIVKKFLKAVTPRVLGVYRQFLEAGVGEIFWVSGPEYLCPPFASPDVFNDLGVTFDKPLFDMIREHGKKTILHCHGMISEVLHGIEDLNPHALHPIEPPPFGDCTLSEARSRLGNEIVLIGNIEYMDLESKSPGEIEDLVKQAIDQGGRERFILSPSCTPFSETLNEHVSDNYIRMIRAGLSNGTNQ